VNTLDGSPTSIEGSSGEPREISTRLTFYALISRTLAEDHTAEDELAELLYSTFEEPTRRRYYYADSEPEDLLQKLALYLFQNDRAVLERIHRKYESLEPGPEYEERVRRAIWDALGGIVANEIRGSKRSPISTAGDPAWLDMEVDRGPTPEGQSISRDSAVRLLDCVGESGSSELLLFLRLKFEGGYSAKEIARMMGIKLRRVYDLTPRLMTVIRNCRKRLGL